MRNCYRPRLSPVYMTLPQTLHHVKWEMPLGEIKEWFIFRLVTESHFYFKAPLLTTYTGHKEECGKIKLTISAGISQTGHWPQVNLQIVSRDMITGTYAALEGNTTNDEYSGRATQIQWGSDKKFNSICIMTSEGDEAMQCMCQPQPEELPLSESEDWIAVLICWVTLWGCIITAFNEWEWKDLTLPQCQSMQYANDDCWENDGIIIAWSTIPSQAIACPWQVNVNKVYWCCRRIWHGWALIYGNHWYDSSHNNSLINGSVAANNFGMILIYG